MHFVNYNYNVGSSEDSAAQWLVRLLVKRLIRAQHPAKAGFRFYPRERLGSNHLPKWVLTDFRAICT